MGVQGENEISPRPKPVPEHPADLACLIGMALDRQRARCAPWS